MIRVFFTLVIFLLFVGCIGLSSKSSTIGSDTSELEWLKLAIPDDFFDPATVVRAVHVGMPAIPLLVKIMKDAEGDIEWRPSVLNPNDPARFIVQFSIKAIIQQNVISGHPKYVGAWNVSRDDSLEILRWWYEEGENVLAGKVYEPPQCMFPYRSMEELEKQLDGIPKTVEKFRLYDAQNAAFAKLGFKSIREMMDNGVHLDALLRDPESVLNPEN